MPITIEGRGLTVNRPLSYETKQVTGLTSPNKTILVKVGKDKQLGIAQSNSQGDFTVNLSSKLAGIDEIIVELHEGEQFVRQITEQVYPMKLTTPRVDGMITAKSQFMRGVTNPNVYIDLINSDGEVVTTVQSNDSGLFVISLDQPFPVNTVISFIAHLGDLESDPVDIQVQEPTADRLHISQARVMGDTRPIVGQIQNPESNYLYHIYVLEDFVKELTRNELKFNLPFPADYQHGDDYYINARRGYGTDDSQFYSPIDYNIQILIVDPITVGDTSVHGSIIGNLPQNYQIRYERPRGDDIIVQNLNHDVFDFNIDTSPVEVVRYGDEVFITILDQAGSVIVPRFQIPVLRGDTETETLEFNSDVADIVFDTTQIENNPNRVIYRQEPEDYVISILDTRAEGSWELTAQAAQPLENDAGHQLRNVLYYKDESLTSIEGEAVKVAKKENSELDPANPETDIVRWDKDEGIVAQTNPLLAQGNTTYSATIQWTLADAPQ